MVVPLEYSQVCGELSAAAVMFSCSAKFHLDDAAITSTCVTFSAHDLSSSKQSIQTETL